MKKLQSVDDIVQKYSVDNKPIKRILYISLGSLFLLFAVIGIWVPGWPTVSWAVPAAFFFSLSNKKLFIWTLTNRFFGSAIFEYYSTGKSLTRHSKIMLSCLILLMSIISSYFVWIISTQGSGELLNPNSWDGKDQDAYGAISILILGVMGVFYMLFFIKSRD